jgi:pimeloyl-ACP methyl ester carboxylesterase
MQSTRLQGGAVTDPVLLLHGQPGGAQDWDGVVAALGPEIDAIAIDRPGWDGRSGPTDLPGNAAAALAALDVRRAQRAVIVGHSLGGGVAAWLAVHHPSRVAGLVLAAPAASTRAIDRVDRLLAAPVVGAVASGALLSGAGLALSAPPVRRRIAVAARLDERYLHAASRRLLRRGARRAFLVEQRALLRDLPALEAALGRISAPTVIVTGSRDRIVPPSASRLVAARIPEAELIELRGAGHLLPHLHAGKLAQIVREAPLRWGMITR